jgi:cytochrome P450
MNSEATAPVTRPSTVYPVGRVAMPTGEPGWLVTGFREAMAVLGDRAFSSDSTKDGFPRLPLARKVVDPGIFLFMDPPDHTRLRAALTREFSGRRVAEMRPAIEGIVHRQIDELIAAGPGADLVTSVAEPVPAYVVCGVLGAPHEDHRLFHELSRALFSDHTSAVRRAVAGQTLLSYLVRLVDAKQVDSGDDLIARLLREEVSGGVVSTAEVAGIALLLLTAGHETTTNMIALGTLALLRHPAQFQELVADPGEERVRAVSEELLRYLTVAQTGLARLAMAAAQIGDHVIAEGDGVIVGLPAANRDPVEYVDPDSLRTDRGPIRHLAFGYGIHQCLGQTLARAELETYLRVLARRLPTLRLATTAEELVFEGKPLLSPVAALPVTW